MKFIRALMLMAMAASLPIIATARTILTPQARADYEARVATGAISDDALRLPGATPEEVDALRFLYAYMPLNDLADRTPAFFLENVRATALADSLMPWAATVPDREWRHFVMPLRVNNENLDMARPAFLAELAPRLQGLSMKDAILEVNHWCHEKVTYRPSDGRTLAPLATVSNALGRCGEESTFAVAALRSVGIPARQVYTPRWAHTDDNHAWVEAWADGEWHFMGACEPEPVLNLGWFNAPASRGLLMHTKAFGRYDGPEERIAADALGTTINVTDVYAPTGIIDVTVVDADGNPVSGASVDFCIYNYAEFSRSATRTTDAGGHATLKAGLGDMIAWATDGNRFGFAKVNARQPNTITLDMAPGAEGSFSLDIVPPAPGGNIPPMTPEQIALNNARKMQEDSIRGAYTVTFYTPARSAELAAATGLPTERVERMMTEARGNHAVIAEFLRSAADKLKALLLLENLSVKDKADVTPDVLADRMTVENTGAWPDDVFGPYVLSARASNEQLSPCHAVFTKLFSDPATRPSDAAELRRWVADNIAVDTIWNPLRYPITPAGVVAQGRADRHSIDIFTILAARSLGIPARINPVTLAVEVGMDEIAPLEVKKDETDATPMARLTLRVPEGTSAPKYYSHFTLGRIGPSTLRPATLEYEEGMTAADFKSLPVAPGNYILISGRRMADGSVLSQADMFNLSAGSDTIVDLTLRADPTRLSVIGNFDSERLYTPLAAGEEPRSLLSTTGRGYYILGFIAPGHEPSAHALNDLSAARKAIEELGDGKVVVLMQGADATRFDASLFPNLPSNLTLGIDPDGSMLTDVIAELGLQPGQLPVFIIADTFNRIVWSSQGYLINLPDALLQALSSINE